MLQVKRLLTGMLMWFALAPGAYAVIISATGDNGNVGLIVVDPPIFNEVNVIKVYDGIGPMVVTLEVDATGFYGITETLINTTADPWEGFTWLLSAPDGVFFFDFLDPPGVAPFTTFTPSGTPASVASVSGGTLLPDDSMVVNLQVLVMSLAGPSLSFSIIEVPTPGQAVPEPGTGALLGLALLGLSLRRRARRR